MITIDYQPVLAITNESSIVFTDSAKSKPSYVYMDKFIAPSANKLVWMEIRNPSYDPEDPNNSEPAYVVNLDADGNYHSKTTYLEHPGNPLYLFRRWMWLENVLSNHLPVNYNRDAEGNPIPKDDGTLDLGDWENHPGIVKLELYEHKHVLTRQASLDNANILHRLTLFINQYNDLLPEKLLNELSWEDLAEFLSLRKVKLDYGVEYQNEHGTPLFSEYPPVLPYHCFWRQKTLCFCLQDLLNNFLSRILSVTLVSPDPQDYLANGQEAIALDEADVLTSMKWRYRRPIEYREDILYEKILWPVDSTESLENEENALIFFRKNGQYNGSPSLYNPGLYYDGVEFRQPSGQRSSYDFICNLYPYVDGYRLSNFEMINNYLKNAHVNIDTEYEFTTKSLPADFYETSEWTEITLRYNDTNYEYHVSHENRPLNFGHNNISTGIFQVAFKGIVKNADVVNGMVFSSLVDITNNIVIDDEVTLPIYDVNAKPFDVIHGLISGDDFIITDRSSVLPDDEPNNEIITVKFNGDKVRSVVWEILSWNPAISALDLQQTDPAGPGRILNYAYEGVRLHPKKNSSAIYPFERAEYLVDLAPSTVTNFNGPESPNLMTVYFVVNVPEEDREQAVIDFLKINELRTIYDAKFIDAMVQKYLYYFERVEVQIGMNHNVTECDFFHHKYMKDRPRTSKGIHPDLDPSQFGVSNFGDIIPGNTGGDIAVPYDSLSGVFPSNLYQFRNSLFNTYYNYMKTFDTKVSLTFLP